MAQEIVWANVPKGEVPRLSSEDEGLEMEKMRCPQCGRFLAYQAIVVGALKVKCRKCKVWVILEIIPPDVIVEEQPEEDA